MASVYFMRNDGTTTSMDRIRCKNEDLELQRVLEHNADLLPGDQIDPDNPRRWLLVKREMPVPDPSTGADRWSIDFMFADQDAIPTFVECKRFADTRARREVVGQMLEYAANGHHYWDKDSLRDFARESAMRRESDLDAVVSALQPSTGISTDAYFDRLQQNLREGQLRIVFFLEESSMELRSVVDFLNKQMERSEVLLVEARQYEFDGTRIVVPTLFGYTEEARLVKRTVTVNTAASRKKWDRCLYFSDAQSRLAPDELIAMERFLDQSLALGYQVSWGSGSLTGSYNLKAPNVCPRSLLSVFSNGRLQINFGWLPSDTSRLLRTKVAESIGLHVPPEDGEQYPSYSITEWGSKTSALLDLLEKIIA